MSFISPITQILHSLDQVKKSPTKYLDKNFRVVEDPALKATLFQLFNVVLKIILGSNLSNKELGKLPKIHDRILILYPDVKGRVIPRLFFERSPLTNGFDFGVRISLVRKSMSALVYLKEKLQFSYHHYLLLMQLSITDEERDKYALKRNIINSSGTTIFDVQFDMPKNIRNALFFKYSNYFKNNALRTNLSKEEIAQFILLLEHSDPHLREFVRIHLIFLKAELASKTFNRFQTTLNYFIKSNWPKLNMPLLRQISSLYLEHMIFWNRTLSDENEKWSMKDVSILTPFWDKAKQQIHELDEKYDYFYQEFQLLIQMHLPLPEMREGWLETFSEGSHVSLLNGNNRYPSPEKFSRNFFQSKQYDGFSVREIADYTHFDSMLSESIVPIPLETSDRKEKEDNKGAAQLVAVKPALKRRASYSDQEWHKLFEAHSNRFPAGIKYDQRVENWFSKLEEKPIATLGDKAAALKHRLPKILDVLVGTTYSRSGIFEENGRRHDSWYLAMRVTAFDRALDGVLAYTLDENEIVYHRYFEKEAQGDELVNEILPWLIENTQSPTPQDVVKMDKKKQETSEKKPSYIAPIPKGIEIEPYFGTLTFQYEDQEIFYNGAPVQVKIEIFKPGN